MMSKQVKSKERVQKHAEVFTNISEINAMLALVDNECTNIESTFLEPACGNGLFLLEVLKKKCLIVKSKYSKNFLNYEKYLVLAVSSIYGVELLEDNVEECRKKLFNFLDNEYKSVLKKNTNLDVLKTFEYILKKNILCGDALSLKNNQNKPIVFSEWKLVHGSKLKRRDFEFDNILRKSANYINKSSTFSNSFEIVEFFIPSPIKDFRPVNYSEVWKVED